MHARPALLPRSDRARARARASACGSRPGTPS
jgi:hypothetical protein